MDYGMELGSKHITYTSSQNIRQICQPLINCFQVSNFSYLKILPDMSRVHLDTDAAWTKFYYQNVEQYYGEYLTEGYHWNSGFAHLFSLEDSCTSDALQHDVGDGMVFSIHENNITELFFLTYCWSEYQTNKVESLMNNVDLIEKFASYFKAMADDIISEAEKCPIVLPFVKQESRELPENSVLQLRKKFVDELEQHMHEKRLTKRERECIFYTAQDLSAKEVANKLYISQKTVERHLENAKKRLGLRKKTSLVNFFMTYNMNFKR